MILEMAKLFQCDANVKNQATQFTPSNTISNNIEISPTLLAGGFNKHYNSRETDTSKVEKSVFLRFFSGF